MQDFRLRYASARLAAALRAEAVSPAGTIIWNCAHAMQAFEDLNCRQLWKL